VTEEATAARYSIISRSANGGGADTPKSDAMIEKRETTFLMTPAQHRQWAENARRVNGPDLAKHHEQLARAIEIIEKRRRVECPSMDSPPIAPAT
jgi:hypothetical protein